MIRVVVVDDEALVRSGFQLILGAADDIEVIAAVDGSEAFAAIERGRPDVVLLDIRMPGRSGLEILADVQTLADPPVVAMLTTFDTEEHISRALAGGAIGFLLKDTDPEHLPVLVRALASGGVVLSPQVSHTVVHGYVDSTDPEAAAALGALTDRERQVLSLLATGSSNAEIAGRMFLGVGTVKDHVSSILAKLGVTTRVQAALIAERGGLTFTESE
ncbi:response regulator [Agromyces sp. NPDC056965]|uniref:response regulator n=1 Tax=Agromyces sp. NPDC056965 TaxID=3345983 RepID=UPI003624C9AF